jgi:hypothetical protein
LPLTSLPRKKQREPISHTQESAARVYNERFLDKLQPTKGVILTKEQRATAWVKMYEEARHHLEKLDANAAATFMQSVGTTVLECYLIAEADGQNRQELLRQFPKPGASARVKFHPEEAVEAPAPAPRPRARTKTKPAAVGAQASGEDMT